MEVALVVLAFVGAFGIFALTILAGNYLIAKKDYLEAQTQAIKADTEFRRRPAQIGTPK